MWAHIVGRSSMVNQFSLSTAALVVSYQGGGEVGTVEVDSSDRAAVARLEARQACGASRGMYLRTRQGESR